MARYDLSEFEWREIQPLLPNKSRGVPRVDDRKVLNGISTFFDPAHPGPIRKYKKRNLIERCFNKLKQFRHIARYDRSALNYLAMAKIACIRLWFRFMSPQSRKLNDSSVLRIQHTRSR